MFSLLEILIVREPGVGGTGFGAEPFGWARFCRATGPLFETRPQRDRILPNDLNPIKDEQIRSVDKVAGRDIEPWVIDVSCWR